MDAEVEDVTKPEDALHEPLKVFQEELIDVKASEKEEKALSLETATLTRERERERERGRFIALIRRQYLRQVSKHCLLFFQSLQMST